MSQNTEMKSEKQSVCSQAAKSSSSPFLLDGGSLGNKREKASISWFNTSMEIEGVTNSHIMSHRPTNRLRQILNAAFNISDVDREAAPLTNLKSAHIIDSESGFWAYRCGEGKAGSGRRPPLPPRRPSPPRSRPAAAPRWCGSQRRRWS